MHNGFITKAALSLCLLAAPGASASDLAPWNPFAPGKTETSRQKKAGTGDFTPKALDQDGNMLPDRVWDVDYHRVTTTQGVVAGPDGDDWFYTLDLDGEKLIDNEYVTEYDYTTFHVKVYDSRFNFVGQAKGEVERPADALKCQSISVGTFITKSFFNSITTDYEITISANFNPAPVEENGVTVNRYGAKQITEAYTLTEELPEGGLSKCLFHAPGYIASSINSGSTLSENYVIALSEETSWDGEDTTHADFVIYKKAGWGTSASEVTRFNIDLSKAYSDGYNEAYPCVMTANGSDIYVATALYEKTFLTDPTSDDPTLTEQNTYVITLHKASGNTYQKIGETRILCEDPEGEFMFRSYALGNFSGTSDITFDFGDGKTPCYIISVVDSDTSDDTSAYYAVYDSNGNEIKRFGNGSDSFTRFWDLKGHPVQYGFDMTTDDGDYATVLVDYPSLETVGFVPKMFEYDGNIWSTTSVPDRAIADGQVLYAASVRLYSGSEDTSADYVAWFTAKGELHHIDTLDFGNAAKVLTNINGSVLNPYLFNTDDEFEYMAWVYRYIDASTSTGTTLELAVCDGKGNLLSSRYVGSNSSIAGAWAYVANSSTDPCIMITYRTLDENRKWYVHGEYIDLPLNKFNGGDGTAESPYIIKTYGDFDQIRNNLTSHFRLANSIDCEGQSFRPIEGEFTGSIDGAGYSIRNLSITSDLSGAAMFKSFGKRAYYATDETSQESVLVTPEKATISNITFHNPSINYSGTTIGQKTFSIVANEAANATMENVYVYEPVFGMANVNIHFGTLANQAIDVTFKSCGVKDADIDLSLGSGIGGLVYEAHGCEFAACSFGGKINGRTNIGGIVGSTLVTPSTLTDCHVNAEITGLSNVGGIVANSNRSVITRCVVEGSISSQANVGGIAGVLDRREESSDDETKVIDNCVVALNEFSVKGAECAHRIVGNSSIDQGYVMEYIPDPDDPENNMTVVQHPATDEEYLGNNYVITDIAPIQIPADGELATEGTTVVSDDVNMNWYVELGYPMGTTVTAPWTMQYLDKVPVLYFEDNIGVTIEFRPSEITGTEGESATAYLYVEGLTLGQMQEAFGAGFVTFWSDNEQAADFNYEMGLGDGCITFGIALKAEGTANLTISYNGMAAVLKVTVNKVSGIKDVTIESAITYSSGIITAAGQTIEVYDIQGRKVSAGTDTVATAGLTTGIYVVRATDSAGRTSVIKINVR